MRNTPLFIFIFISFQLIGQRIHEPAEILRMMEKSEIVYTIDTLIQEKKEARYNDIGQKSERLVRIATETEVRLDEERPLNENKKLKNKLKKGDKNLGKGKNEKARVCFTKANEISPSDTRIINRIGDSYFYEKDYPSAVFWYDRALEFNSINTDALVQSALAHMEMGDSEKALSRISLAHIYNRNDKKVLEQLKTVYEKFGLNYNDTHFEPVYKLSKNDDKNIKIEYGHSIWAAYAAVKAVWKFEPNYSQDMAKLSRQTEDIIREKEAVFNALLTYESLEDSNKAKQFPLLALLSEISIKGQIDNFIMYEIISRIDPLYPLLLSSEKQESLKNYLLTYRSKIK